MESLMKGVEEMWKWRVLFLMVFEFYSDLNETPIM